MLNIKKYSKSSHSKHKLLIHIVLVTKYRKKILEKINIPVKNAIEKVCNERKCSLVAYEHDQDHIHILVEYPPKHNVSLLVQLLKQRTTYDSWQFDEKYMRTNYWSGKHILWSNGYFSCSVGDASEDTIKKYIEQQG